MFSWSAVQLLSLKPLVTLLALVNPLASIPFFIHITQGFDAALRKKQSASRVFPCWWCW
jgi:hypothetical protein